MKIQYHIFALLFMATATQVFGQDGESTEVLPREEHRIKTIFNNNGPRSSGGYVAMTNKFTTINGDFANMVELYGGWYINHRFLIGLGAAATTNFIPVPIEHSVDPYENMSYEYVQAGLMTEYVVASDRAIHFAFQIFAGGGCTLQYERPESDDDWDDFDDDDFDYDHDENTFAVAEPGVRVEVNVFKWLRFSPGISYRLAYGANGRGLTNTALENTSVNMTLKIGKF